MRQILEYFKIAFFNLKANKMRTFLTMLGIIIGIGSVVVVVSSGMGVKKSLESEVTSLVGSYVDIYAQTDDITLNDDDLEAISKIPHVTGLGRQYSTRNASVETSSKYFKAQVTYESANFQEYNRAKLVQGRFFTEDEEERAAAVCIIDEEDAKAIFGHKSVIGYKLDVTIVNTTEEYVIVGVREHKGAGLDGLLYGISGSQERTVTLEVPFNTVLEKCVPEHLVDTFTGGSVSLLVDDMENGPEVGKKAMNLLNKRHHVVDKDNGFSYYEMSFLTETVSGTLLIVTLLISFIAAIALLVGGIGVMNIMLVTVTERTKEIGIRKALGARTNSVMLQFLIESGVIALVGGTIGLVGGYTLSVVGCAIASKVVGSFHIAPDFNPFFILGTMIFSMGIGIFFGVIPAKKAAKLTPVDALRHK